jgi:S-adenosylmethionine:tRNA ribosyltransferase-isomerase
LKFEYFLHSQQPVSYIHNSQNRRQLAAQPMHPKNISIADFIYDLPQDQIAHYPLPERDASKLLIYQEGLIREDTYKNISRHLPENSLLIFNNTKVVEARILFRKSTGAQIELFCLEPPPEYPGIAAAMMQTCKVRWKCLIGGASKWKPGQVLSRPINMQPMLQGTSPTGNNNDKDEGNDASGIADGILEARYLEKLEDAFLIELSWTPAHLSFAEMLHKAGLIPLPPYIRRVPEASDSERYQTIYAAHDGSVAAPTAGLHFSESIFTSLEQKNIQRSFVTLHVGAGTFLPVKSDTMEQHIMHTEYISVTRATLRTLITALPRPVIPVGTTSLRTIESLYWLGLQITRDPAIAPEDLAVHQWDPYESAIENNSITATNISSEQALKALLSWMDRQELDQLMARTQLLITPGYDWKIANALITNFHQPESTLLLLVAAMIGDDWRKVYQYALDHQFRFLSYGDGSLLFPSQLKREA